jgi:protocatechuate 3,4-dioxygenase beta subunit
MKKDHDHHDGGLHEDLRAMASLADRRQALRLLAGACLTPLLACSSSDATSSSGNDGGTSTTDGSAAADGAGSTTDSSIATPDTCSAIPEETGGPYPGDGTNGPNTLTASGVVRSDIRSSFGTMTGTAAGIPLTIKLKLVNTKGTCASLAGYAIYLWHCDRDGKYSLYTVATENYLRGLQETDADGTVTFTSIFPACYSGRWPHIHFEIFSSLAKATAATGKIKTSQLALPEDKCKEVFATTGYEASVSSLAQVSLAKDNVFSDGATTQIATVTGDTTTGYTATLVVGVAV